MAELFASLRRRRPLADRLRPQAPRRGRRPGSPARPGRADRPHGGGAQAASMILWGPPGCGKTTIARLLAEAADLHFEPLSAVFSGVADLRKVFEAAQQAARSGGQGTLLFVDEIHRFNRAQQDGFLPYVEDGTVILVGATTENPSFELNGALLSRCQVFVLQPPRRRGAGDPARSAPRRARAARCRSTPEARAGADRHGRRRRPLPAEPGRGAGAARQRRRRSTPPELAATCCRSARRSTTRRRRATTT